MKHHNNNGSTKDINLKHTMQSTYSVIIMLMLVPSILSFLITARHTKTYDNIITNVSRANNIEKIAKNDLPNELWDIVCGRKEFSEGNQYKIIDDITGGINTIHEKTNSDQDRQLLEVALRTSHTLTRNISMLGIKIAGGSSVAENEAMLEEIRTITVLLSDIMQDYIVSEIESAEILNNSIKKSTILYSVFLIAIIIAVIIISTRGIMKMSDNIRNPITNMEVLSTKIANGDMSARVPQPQVQELNHLAQNLNIMAEQIELLIKKNIAEQQNLQKAEIKALQAQITPHFLYNTFDTIIWLAEEEQTQEVVKVTKAFSEFLRISLSRGHEWITVQQEIEHIKNYLTIQKIRYADILNYEISTDPELNEFKMLKLVLQPLVENAIYHGIKNKRGRGNIKVTAEFTDSSKKYMRFAVIDDGAGFSPERLIQVQSELNKDMSEMEQLSSVYGIFNVNKKLFLYYNTETTGLKIETKYGKGSTISFTVPCVKESSKENV